MPPDWFATTPIHWDTNKPWKDARLEIRRLLALDEASVREAVKLTWLYSQKGDIGDGHELPMYLFMSGNYAWATLEYPKFLKRVANNGATHGYRCYASCLAHFGEYKQALRVLDDALRDLPAAPWCINSMAGIQEQYGDLYAKMGDLPKARQHYAEAMRLYPTSDQPYGRHLLARNVAKIKSKLDLLAMQSLSTAKLRDGSYTGRAPAYSETKDIEVTLTVASGKISNLDVRHEEKIDLNATKIIPQRIIEKQSVQVDAVTGATVTSQAIVEAAFQALKQAGLQ
ncbi:MAG TPA: FMN-binding protein [Verrucomicrobiae bacterium]